LGGCGAGVGDRPLSITIEESSITSEKNILVLPGWKLPHGWRISSGGLAVPPIQPEGPAMTGRHRTLPSDQRNHLDWAPTRDLWRPLFAKKWRTIVAEFDLGAPSYTRSNNAGGRAWWRGRVFEDVLHQHGYRPKFHCYNPARGDMVCTGARKIGTTLIRDVIRERSSRLMYPLLTRHSVLSSGSAAMP
jgi:hypothetical protein